MAIIRCKGTVFSVAVSGAVAPIAQVLSLELPEAKGETFEADTLDNSGVGIPHKATGRVEGGELSGELFLDLAIHTGITGFLTTPPAVGDSGAGSIAFPGGTGMHFDIAGMGLGGSVALKEGLKGKFSAKLDGIPDYSGSA